MTNREQFEKLENSLKNDPNNEPENIERTSNMSSKNRCEKMIDQMTNIRSLGRERVVSDGAGEQTN